MNFDFLTNHRFFETDCSYKEGFYLEKSFQFSQKVEHGLNDNSSVNLKIDYSSKEKKLYIYGKYSGVDKKEWSGDVYKKIEDMPFWFQELVNKMHELLENEHNQSYKVELTNKTSFALKMNHNSITDKIKERKKERDKVMKRINMMTKRGYEDEHARTQHIFEEAIDIVLYIERIIGLTHIKWDKAFLDNLNRLNHFDAKQLKGFINQMYDYFGGISDDTWLKTEPLAILHSMLYPANLNISEAKKNKYGFDDDFLDGMESKRLQIKELAKREEIGLPSSTVDIDLKTKKDFLLDERVPKGQKLYLLTEMLDNGELDFADIQSNIKAIGFYESNWHSERKKVNEELIKRSKTTI